MNKIEEIYTDLDGEPLPADEALDLARHIAAQGEEAGFTADVIRDAEARVAAVERQEPCSGCGEVIHWPVRAATFYCDDCIEVAGSDLATRQAHYAAVRERKVTA